MSTFQTEVDSLLMAVFESVATVGKVSLTGGASGTVDSITVDAVTITSAAVAYNTSLAITAVDVAANINAFTSTPDYKAIAYGDDVIIIPDDGLSADTFVVVSAATTITTADTNVSAGTGSNTVALAYNPNEAVRDRGFTNSFIVEFFHGVKDTSLFSGGAICDQAKGHLNKFLTQALNAQ